MKYRKLGRSSVSEICLGTMTFGEQNTEQEAHQQLDFALAEGINFIDTAEVYPVPVSRHKATRTETYIGNWLAKRKKRDDIILATKVAGRSNMSYMRSGMKSPAKETRLSAEQISFACDNSLKRLQTDYIDLYQIHWPERSSNFFGRLNYEHKEDDDAIDLQETLEALARLVEAGKVRYLGVSNETPWGVMRLIHLAKTMDLPPIVSIQNPYNLLCRPYDIGLAEISMRESCGLLAYSPLAFGALTGKYLNGNRPAGARITLWEKEFPRYFTLLGQKATAEYVQLAKDNGLDPSQMAISYLLTKPFMTSIIIGATNLHQLETDIKAADVFLSEEVLNQIEEIAVRYSNPCP